MGNWKFIMLPILKGIKEVLEERLTGKPRDGRHEVLLVVR